MSAVTRVFIFAMLVVSAATAQSTIPNNPGKKATVVIRNVAIYPVTSAPIMKGSIVIDRGIIAAIGTNVTAPQNAEVIDGTGLSVYPGLIDSGTNVGLTEISSVAGTNDITELGDLNSNAIAAVAVNPHSKVIPVTRANGVLVVLTNPEGGLISGHASLIQMAGWTPPEMVIQERAGLVINFPRAFSAASSDVPQEEEVEKEATKAYTNQIDKLRDTFRDAQAYAKLLGARQREKSTPRVDRDLILENLVPVVEGRVPVIIVANRAADIKEAIKFAKELSLKMILAGGEDVQRVIPELQAAKIPVILGPILSLPPREDDPYDLLFTNALALHKAGIRFSIQSADTHNARNLPYHAAACAAFGLPKEEALKAITIYPAQIFGVSDSLGSLEVGKIANVIVTDGDPLEIVTNVRHIFIAGEKITTETHQTQLYEKFQRRP